jgi:hypothetical protein
MDDQDGQPIEKRQGSQKPVSDQNLAGQTCPTCNVGKLELRNLKDSEKQFWGCSKFQDGCRHFVWAK